MLHLPAVDRQWSLFLDRDGVINYEKKDDYIRHPGEFRFYPGVQRSLKILGDLFGVIVMVTNQRGIGRGLMTEADLADIHAHMLTGILQSDGRIDKIYYCTAVDAADYNRKPNPGMAHQARMDFANIDFSRSIMVGNKLSDMQFGRNAGMFTVYVNTTHPDIPFPNPLIDWRFDDLAAFADALLDLAATNG